jgi:hypothetical protein
MEAVEMEAVEMEDIQQEWRREQRRIRRQQQQAQEMEAVEMEAVEMEAIQGVRRREHQRQRRRQQAMDQRGTQSPPQKLSAVSPEPEPDNDNAPNQFQPIHSPPINPAIHPVRFIVVSPNALPLPRPVQGLPQPIQIPIQGLPQPIQIPVPPPPPPMVVAPPHVRSLHSILEGLGNGSIASIEEIGMEIHQHPDMIDSGKRFHDVMTKYRRDNWFHCPNCKERSFETKPSGAGDGAGAACTKCSKSRLSNGISVFSAANKGDPIPIPLPPTLPVLTHIEEMLIARKHATGFGQSKF